MWLLIGLRKLTEAAVLSPTIATLVGRLWVAPWASFITKGKVCSACILPVAEVWNT